MSGDRTRLVEEERFDLPDALSLQDLVYAYLDQALGGLMGFGGGCLSPPKFTLSQVGPSYFLALGAFAFYHSEQSLTDDAGTTYKGWKGRTLFHKPADSGNIPAASKLNYTTVKAAAEVAFAGPGLTPFSSAGCYPFIWARPILVNADSDARRQWNLGAGSEQPVTMTTRQRIRCEFSFGTSNTAAPADDGGYKWVAVAKIVDWTGNGGALVPSIQALSVWDSQELWTATSEPNANAFDDGLNSNGGSEATVNMSTFMDALQSGDALFGGGFHQTGKNRSLGLIPMLHLLRNAIKRQGSNGSAQWFHPAANLESLLDLANDALSTNNEQDTRLDRLEDVFLVGAGKVEFDGVGNTYSFPVGWTAEGPWSLTLTYADPVAFPGQVKITVNTAAPSTISVVGMTVSPFNVSARIPYVDVQQFASTADCRAYLEDTASTRVNHDFIFAIYARHGA